MGEIYERAKRAFMFGDKMHEDRESVGILNIGWEGLWRVEKWNDRQHTKQSVSLGPEQPPAHSRWQQLLT